MADPVLIVGAGPVGLTMAAELTRYGVRVRIVERAPSRTDKSKALVVWARTLELLDRAGCAQDFVAAGFKAHAVDIMSEAGLIGQISLDGIDSAFQFILMLPQSETERLLEAHLQRLGVTVERTTEFLKLDDVGDHVSCTIRREGGEEESFDAGWLIGCDGAHSTVRHRLGMSFEGETLASNFLLADVHVAGLKTPESDFPLYWHRHGIVGFFPIEAGRFRVIVDIGDIAAREPTLEEVQALVTERVAGGVTLSSPVWLSGFGVNERKVREFRSGRVFLAGDAAHIHSPAGGQGMNTGMQDAINLAWKLALVERGAPASLLDSYSIERSAVAAQVLTDSGRMLRLALLQNPVAQRVRNFVAHQLLGFSAVRHSLAEKLSELSVGYGESPLNGAAVRGLAGPMPGERIVAGAPFGAGDVPRFAVCARTGIGAEALLAEFPELLEPALRPPVHEDGIWLVRPDGYVAAVARAGDAGSIAASLAKLR